MMNTLLIFFSLGYLAFAKKKESKTEDTKGEAEFEDHESVAQLTLKNFDGYLVMNKVLVQFWDAECEPCKEIAPAYSKLATALANTGSSIKVAKFDCTENTTWPLRDKYKIYGFPTLKYFEGGEYVEDYQMEGDFESLMKWAKAREKPAAFDMPYEEFAALTADGDLSSSKVIHDLEQRFGGVPFMVVCLNLKGSKRAQAFDKFARTQRNTGMPFVNVLLKKAQAKALKNKGVMSRKGIHILRLRLKKERDGGPLVTFTGKLKAFKDFLKIGIHPLFVDADHKSFRSTGPLLQHTQIGGFDLLSLTVDYSDEEAIERLKDGLWRFAAKMRKKGISTRPLVVGLTENRGNATVNTMLSTVEEIPDYKLSLGENTQKVLKGVSHYYFATIDEFTEENVASFVEKAYAGEWHEHIKTRLNDPVFEENYRKGDAYKMKQNALATGDFKEMTSTLQTFYNEDTDTFLRNPDYDRIVLYKAEPCYFCEKLTEKMEAQILYVNSEFVKKVRNQFVFGVYDIVDESTTEFTGTPVPFIVLYPKGTSDFEDGIRTTVGESGKAQEVMESLTMESFVDFLEDYSGVLNDDDDTKMEL